MSALDILKQFDHPLPGNPGREEIEDQEGWMVSYADLITLLFIFFAMLASISAVSKAKFDLLSNQFNRSSVTSLSALKEKLDADIQKQEIQAQVTTQLGDEGLQIQFSEGVLFGSGEAVLNESGSQVLARFTQVVAGIEKSFHIAVEGHTDDRPIHTEQFSSNWALSAGRAVNVLHFISANGIDERRMMVRAFADTRPVATVAENRAQNRRVTILVF